MSTNIKSDRSGTASLASITSLHGDVSRQAGNIRAVTLDEKTMTADRIFCADKAVREAIDDTFGKITQDVRLETDRKAYELKDNAQNAFERTKNTWE
jgi:hypothetical protein